MCAGAAQKTDPVPTYRTRHQLVTLQANKNLDRLERDLMAQLEEMKKFIKQNYDIGQANSEFVSALEKQMQEIREATSERVSALKKQMQEMRMFTRCASGGGGGGGNEGKVGVSGKKNSDDEC